MKWMIAFLWLVGASGLVGAATNVQHFSLGRETTVIYYTPSGRAFALFVGLACTIAAYMCRKKMKTGWHIVSVMICALMLTTMWGVVRVIAVDPFLALAWFAQIVLMTFLFRWWLWQAKYFTPNEEKA